VNEEKLGNSPVPQDIMLKRLSMFDCFWKPNNFFEREDQLHTDLRMITRQKQVEHEREREREGCEDKKPVRRKRKEEWKRIVTNAKPLFPRICFAIML
jgi:hypothetical protein